MINSENNNKSFPKIANQFNYFVNIWPNLSKEKPDTTASVLDFISIPNAQSLFLTPITKYC